VNAVMDGDRTLLYRQRILPNLEKIAKLIEEGETDMSIAQQLGVSRRQYSYWKQHYSELGEIYNYANIVMCSKVQNALFKSACGFTALEKSTKKKNGVVVEESETEKYYAPNTTAAMFFLANRDPEHWRSIQHIQVANIQKNDFNVQVAEGRLKELMEGIKELQASSIEASGGAALEASNAEAISEAIEAAAAISDEACSDEA